MNPVLDASLFIAALSPAEGRHALAKAALDRQPTAEPFLVPAIFRVEVIAGLARRGESRVILDLVDARIRGPRFVSCPMDDELLQEATEIATTARLRAYDAVYVALARLRRAPLYTLDTELRLRVVASYPMVVLNEVG